MSQTLETGEAELQTALVQYLLQKASSASDAAAAQAVAEDVAAKIFGGARTDENQIDLLKVFKAGCEKLDIALKTPASSSQDVDPALEASPKFQKYLTRVKEKGFFAGVEEGSAEYNDKYKRLVAKYVEKFGSDASSAAPAAPAAAAEDNSDEIEADKLKEQGNQFLKDKEYEQAVVAYSKAIDLCPAGKNTYVYYANRAAAYVYLKNYESCLEDCNVSITLNPGYAKAHARASTAALALGRHEEARKAAKRAQELEPGNAAAQKTLDTLSKGTVDAASSGAGAGGMPDMSSFANMMRGMDPSALDQMRQMGQDAGFTPGGGMPDIGSLMGNPGLMQAAQQMMSQNPQMMQMAQQMMQDPDAMSNMMKMMGNFGK